MVGDASLLLGDISPLKMSQPLTASLQPLASAPAGRHYFLAGNFNFNLTAPEGSHCGEDIMAAITAEGLEDLSANFISRRKSWARDGRMWCMCRCRREARPQTDYIIGTYFCLFQKVSVWYPLHKYDHYMVIGCLHGAHQSGPFLLPGEAPAVTSAPPMNKNPGGSVVLGSQASYPQAAAQRREAE